MNDRQIGKIKVSRICMGCWALSGDGYWGPQTESDSIRALHAAVDAGINFFDTAEGYGVTAQEVLGRAFSDRRDDIVIGTKVGAEHLSKEDVVRACEDSLRRMKTDFIDIYHIHWANPSVPISETLEALKKLKEEGKIKAVGVCNFGVQDLQGILSYDLVEVNQLPYNLLWRAVEDEIFPFCIKNDIKVTYYSPLSQGLLTGKFHSPADVPAGRARTRLFSGSRPTVGHTDDGAESETFATIDDIRHIAEEMDVPMGQMAIAWVLSHSEVASVIVGARNVEQIQENARAADLELSADVISRLSEVTDGLKQKLGSNPDLWSSDCRIH